VPSDPNPAKSRRTVVAVTPASSLIWRESMLFSPRRCQPSTMR
jgi:hypothetical protein